jgi:asparagine synthetase B (glutamine-hydrolysing)
VPQSLANALYFAARGAGHLAGAPYTSAARVLLSGLGADELLGGYSRHRSAFARGGWPAFAAELRAELARLPVRNLGRDDRVVASRGREARHPFLALPLVRALGALPAHAKADPRAGPGVGDKLALRLAARRLGLVEASGRHKKAMQFGSHSARMVGGAADRTGELVLG